MINPRIRTNRISATVNPAALENLFDVYEVKREEKISANDTIWDIWGDRVKAVAYASSTSIYVMTSKGDKREDILAIVSKTNERSSSVKVTPCEWSTKRIPLHLQVQLLLNGLSSFRSNSLSFCNITGKLYVGRPEWRNDKKGEIYCLGIRSKYDGTLQFGGTTFTKVENLHENRAEKLAGKPRYVLGGNGYSLKRVFGEEANSIENYVHAPLVKDSKPSVSAMPYFSIIANEEGDALVASKTSVLMDIIETFNRRYEGAASLAFHEIEAYEALSVGNIKKADYEKVVRKLQGKTINIVDLVKTDESEEMKRIIGEAVNSTWGRLLKESGLSKRIEIDARDLCITYKSRIAKDCYNIVLIHEKEYYDSKTDAHKNYLAVPVQHITIENENLRRKKQLRPLVDTCVNNLIIKDDIINGRISIYDWKSYGYQNDVKVAIRVLQGEEILYLVMTIHPDGTFEFAESRLTLFNYEDSELDALFQAADNSNRKVEAIVSLDEENSCYIYDSGTITLPEVERIHEEMFVNKNSAIRGENSRANLFSGNIDLKAWYNEEGFNYFAGEIGYGLARTFQNAPHIYRIANVDGGIAALDVDKFLPLMAVTTVRTGRLTVLPFPVKYLREKAEATGYTVANY